ncbi:dentin matrix acidic phosphoprotein 1-like protein [Pitangus sulphuratus]|nr:dentin matrix acidic phosphoprotein 1-like protein [Pitangus sulphuratus]
MYDEYGEVLVENDAGYYYSPHGPPADEGMSQVRGAPSRGISQAAGAQIGARPLGGGMDPRRGPGPCRTGQGKRRLRAVMHVSRVAVSAHKPVGRAESARSRWKKAKIFPMILQKVKGSRKDSSYAKLMSARQADGDKSVIIRGSYFQKSTDDRPSVRKLNHVLKRISVSRKLQEPLGRDLARGEEESEREEAKSGVSISITAESEQEESDYEKGKKRRRRTSEESSEKSSSSGSESEDKDYLKITLDQDEATESTVDSDEETGQDLGDSEDDSESSSSSESEEDSSEEDEDEEDSDSDEGSSLSKSSSTRSSYSRSGTSESSSRRSTEMSSVKSRGGSSHGRARRSSQKSSGSTASGTDRDTSYRKTSGSSYKSKTSSASVEIEDTIEEVSEEEEEADEAAENSSKAVSKTSAKPGEGKKGKPAVSGEDSEEESAGEAGTDGSDREETLSKNESSCLESEISGISKGPKEKKMKTGKKWAKKKRIKLVVDPEYETSSTGEDSAPDSGQRSRLSSASVQPNVNGNVYIAQNGSVVRTRRACLGNNLKATSPVRLGKQFKKLDKLAVTHEESVPLNTLSKGPTPGDKMNTRPCSVSFAASTIGAENTVTKPGGSKTKSTDERESVVDHEDVREPLESHSEHTQSDEEELWMGPWNNLHIPMTKL